MDPEAIALLVSFCALLVALASALKQLFEPVEFPALAEAEAPTNPGALAEAECQGLATLPRISYEKGE